MVAVGELPPIDAVFTVDPKPWAVMTRAAARRPKNTPPKLTETSRWKSSVDVSATGFGSLVTPALLTMMPSRPELVRHGTDQFLDRLFVTDVSLLESGGDAVGNVLARVHRYDGDRDVRPFSGEEFRGRLVQPEEPPVTMDTLSARRPVGGMSFSWTTPELGNGLVHPKVIVCLPGWTHTVA